MTIIMLPTRLVAMRKDPKGKRFLINQRDFNSEIHLTAEEADALSVEINKDETEETAKPAIAEELRPARVSARRRDV